MISLSSAKPGYGLEQLVGDSSLFWQSDGPLPHTLSYSFPKRSFVSAVSLLLDFKQDESYTPQQLMVVCDDISVALESFVEPTGWVRISVGQACFQLSVQIIQNHQNGKDSHVRGIKLDTN